MQVKEHIDKIIWTIADKALFFLYFFVLLIQVKSLTLIDYGVFELLRNLNIWMLGLSDSLVLQGLIQFGIDKNEQKKVNTISLIIYSLLLLGTSLIVFLFSAPFAGLFGQSLLINVAQILPILTLCSIPRNYIIKLLYREYKLGSIFWIDLVYFLTMTIMTFYMLGQGNQLNYSSMVNILLIGTIISSIFAIFIARDLLNFGLDGKFKANQVFKFGLPLMMQGIFHSLPKYLDVYFVQFFFSTSTVGVYSLAKNLYRVFDDIVSAIYGLIYPAIVRQISTGNREGLHSIITKSISFNLTLFLIVVLSLELGLADWFIITFLPERYYNSIPVFKVIILASLPLVFILLSTVITAAGKPSVIMIYSFISALASFGAYIISGVLQLTELIPLGIITYNLIMGVLCYIFVKNNYGFPVKLLFRAPIDSFYYFKNSVAIRNSKK